MSQQLAARANAVAGKLQGKVSFDPISIITIVFGLLSQCWQQQGTSETPKERLESHYNSETGQFEENTIGQVRGQVRRGIRIAHRKDHTQPKYRDVTEEEIHAISNEVLLNAMNSDDNDNDETMTQALAFISAV